MQWMSSKDIREKFLNFFEEKAHKRLPSSPLVPNDPQLHFTVAGMVPFKPIFWGKMEPTYTRITTCQKCLRTNDIENVGKTPRHQTFFEMLGNFSFGDYFKKEAIEWAWEFLTKVLNIPEEKLWPSVYLEDEEAYNIWKNDIGVPENRIMKFDKSENWWGPVGPTGPCGPSSEIYFDTGFKDKCDDSDNCSPACECGRFVEIWNIVFTEYYADEDGSFRPLSRKNIDTGAGLERITAAIQGVYSNFDTDLFQDIISVVEKVFNRKYGENASDDIAMKIIADHTRALSFIIAEGVLPSNEGRGYVLRRILRRALRYGNLLGKNEQFLNKIVDAVVEKMGSVYTELNEKHAFVRKIVDAEEKRFLETLEKGIQKLNGMVENGNIISGKDVFELYDTYGFPYDITEEILQEKNIKINREEFDELMTQQKERARKAAGNKEYDKANSAYKTAGEELRETVFTGYENSEEDAELLYIIKGEEFYSYAGEGEEAEFIFAKTPFYAEKGGQVSDTGSIFSGDSFADVKDVQIVYNDVISHKVVVKKGIFNIGDTFKLKVDKDYRNSVKRNHSATHLLHSALRNIVGDHVKQAGSYVNSERLRFDFNHYEAVTPQQIKLMEEEVNKKILEAIEVITDVKTLEEAKSENVIALFEEKYGNFVRVVKMGDYSRELCGGTHVKNTGEIGLFKIVSESSVSAGVRRIEAITGMEAYKYTHKLEEILKEINARTDATYETVNEKIEGLLLKNREYEKNIKNLESKIAILSLDNFIKNVSDVNGCKVFTAVMSGLDNDVMRNTIDVMSGKLKSGIVILFNKTDKVSFAVKVSQDMLKTYHAGNIAKKISAALGGGGGGRPDFAQAGGKFPEKIDGIIKNIEKYL